MRSFDYSLNYKELDLRERPELYAIGRGEQGVLSVEPYKSEILPHWKFKDRNAATLSSDTIFTMFLNYLEKNDFIGADMARKFLQMGFTRARRYANYKGGKKYDGKVPEDKRGQSGAHGREENDRGSGDPEKAVAAAIFKAKWDMARENEEYIRQRQKFITDHG